MTSHNLENFSDFFTPSGISEGTPVEGEALIIVAETSNIIPVELPTEEVRRADSIIHLESRSRYLAGRYLLRGILSQWIGIRARDLQITLTSSGKPFLSQSGMPHFSMTHTASTIAVVFSTQAVGIDLEQERPVDPFALARRFFSAEEADYLKQSGSQADFFRLWTCREAAIKGDGRGLASLLSSTRAEPDGIRSGGPMQVVIEDVSWSAIPWILPGGIHGSVAFREVPRVIRWCDPG